ncbi:MAG: hypothetical protein K8S98_08535 [Planctomycetes bacterium]|nr:hypothetical protein [Planctomycetota bacterium]
MRLLPLQWLAAGCLATLVSAQNPPPAKGAAPQRPGAQGPQRPGPQKGGAGKGAPGKGAPGKGAPGKRAPGKGAKPGARGATRAVEAPPLPPQPESAPPQLAALSGTADPIALALADDGKHLFSVEGTSLLMLDASKPALPEVARAVLDATVLGLVCSQNALYIAGGPNGVGFLDVDGLTPRAPADPKKQADPNQPAAPPVRKSVEWFDQADGRPCTHVEVTQTLVLATFTTDRKSELRVYMRAGRKLVGSVKMPGRALDIAVKDSYAYLALGQLGVVRADLQFLKQPKLDRGPDLTRIDVPEHFHLQRGFARELAVAGDSLYVAADIAGLVEIDLTRPWGTTESFRARPLTFLGRPAYAVRVDARGERVAVGTARMPALVGDGAPYGLLGKLGWDFSTADIPLGDWQPGASEALWVFQHPQGATLDLVGIEAIDDSSWRGLAIGGRRVYEQHVKLGVIVREISDLPRIAQAGDAKVPLEGALKLVGRRKTSGLVCVDGEPSLQDPHLLFFATDPTGSAGKGFLRIMGDQLKSPPELAALPPLGTTVGAQWPDAASSREWLMSGGPRSWRIHRFTHRPKVQLDSWELVPPAPPDQKDGGTRGRVNFNSTCDGELILATRDDTRFGLVGYSTTAVMTVLGMSKPGSRVILEPLWQLPTHFDDERPASRTWRAKVFALEDGRRIAAIAAGANTNPEGEHFEEPQLVLYDVTNGTSTKPRLLGVAWGDERKSLAVAVDAFQLGHRAYVAVATTGGQMLIFDVNAPEKPTLVRSYKAPISPYDGERENLLDLEIATEQDSGRVFAYLAAGRAGLLRVELTPTDDALAPDVVMDTPGWACGVTSTLFGGERYWLVGDQRAGLRLYR